MEGTCAAWVGEMVINGHVAKAADLIGTTHENGWLVDEDMARHVQGYVDTIMAREGATTQAEVALQHPTLPVGGTADNIGRKGDTLYIDDLKYGYGIVEPTSWQLVVYMWLVLSGMAPHNYPRLIQLAIHQPRAIHRNGTYRKWVIDMNEAWGLCQQVQQRVVDLTQGETTGVPGYHCLHCAMASTCTALTRSVYSMWDVVQHREYDAPTASQLSEELVMLDRMEALLTARKVAVEAEAEARMDEGQYIPGWAMYPRYGKKMFTVDRTVVEMTTGTDASVKKLCTPAELLRRGADKDVVESITTTPRIGHKLERITMKEKP